MPAARHRRRHRKPGRRRALELLAAAQHLSVDCWCDPLSRCVGDALDESAFARVEKSIVTLCCAYAGGGAETGRLSSFPATLFSRCRARWRTRVGQHLLDRSCQSATDLLFLGVATGTVQRIAGANVTRVPLVAASLSAGRRPCGVFTGLPCPATVPRHTWRATLICVYARLSRSRAANLARPLFASSTRDRLLIAASDRARASGSLDGYRPAAPVAPVIGIIVIPTIALTVAGSTNVN